MAEDPPLLGFKVFQDGEEKIQQFISVFESTHMKWLEEILIEAKMHFRRDDIPLLPKTPAVKNRTRKGRRVARKSSIAPVDADDIPAKRSRTSERQATKRQSSQPISEFHEDAIKNAAQTSPPIAIPPPKKIKEEILSPVRAAVEETATPTAPSVPVKEEVVEAEFVAPVEVSPPAKRSRATRASTRPSTVRTAAKQGPKTQVTTKKGRGSKKKSSTEAETSQDEGATSAKETEAPVKVEKAAPPVKTKPVRASSRAATRAATSTRQSARSRLAQNVCQSPTASSPQVRAAQSSVKGKRLCSKLVNTTQSPSTPGANRYKDHVKRLVKLHETEISKVHTAEEASSPKRPRLGQAPCSPKTPKTPKSMKSDSPFRSSPILSLKVRSKATVTKGKPIQKESQAGSSGTKGKAVLGEEKAKEVSAFFSSLTSKAVKANPPADTPQQETSQQEKETPPDAPTKEIIKDDHRSDDDDDKAEPIAAANDTALSQDSLDEPPDSHDDTDSHLSTQVISMKSFSSSSGMEEDSLMEEKKIPSGRSTRRSSRRSSIAVSQSKRRTSTYLRLHPGRQSSIRRSSARISKRLSMAVSMERDSLESSVEELLAVRQSPRLQAQASDQTNSSSSSSGSGLSSCDSDDIIDKTPSPECPPSKVIRPHPKSFVNSLNKKKKFITPGTPQSGSVITSFIQRNTPQKKSLKEQQQERKAQLLEKQKKEENIKKKLIEERRKNIQDQKRIRDERMKRVRETKAQQELEKIHQKKQKIQEREELKQTLTEKQKEERKKDEQQRGKLYEKKKAEAEERRKQEMEAKLRKIKEQEDEKRRHQHLLDRKREYEEQERQRRAEEQRQQAEQQRLKQEKLKLEEMVKKREQTLAREKEQQRLREERERERKEQERRRQQEAEQRERERKAKEEAERQRKIAADRALREKQRKEEEAHVKTITEKERAKQEHERLKANILKQNTSINQQHNTSGLNSTFNKDKVENSPQSYDLTPQRIYVAASAENYGIDDLRSDDSSDDEEAPRKKIPSWAQGGALKTALINQHYHPPDFQALFPVVEPPNLSVMFVKKRARFTKRTSSAVWNSPILHHLR